MDIIAAIRDILISLYLLAGIVLVLGMLVFAYLLYRASKGLVGTVTRTAENFEKVSDAAVQHIAKPLEEGVSVGSVAGNAVGFATGFVAGMRGRKSGDKDESEESGGGDGAAPKKKKRRIPFL